MAIDPYQNCPCGSGKKLKWCCQKLLKYIERAEQLLETNQDAAALQVLDEGLAIDPASLWLRTMKAEVLMSGGSHEAADELVDANLASHSDHVPSLRVRLQGHILRGMMPEAVLTLQELAQAESPENRGGVLEWTRLVGGLLAESGEAFAALAHLRLLAAQPERSEDVARAVADFEANPSLAPWLRDTWQLRTAPRDEAWLSGPWDQATEAAASGLWSKAAALFDQIASQRPHIAAAWFNLGLCLGWLCKDPEAADALHHCAELDSDPEQALHAEALAQCLDARESEQTVGVVRVRHPIRDRTLLIQRLKDHPRLQLHFLDHEQQHESDAENEFYLLDKPMPGASDSWTADSVPSVTGFVRTHGLEMELDFVEPAEDDPRPALVLEAAGDSIDPNGHREEVGTVPLSVHRLKRAIALPSHLRRDAWHRTRRELNQQVYRGPWLDTPRGWLNNKTPLEASQIAELKRGLRAAVLLAEYECEAYRFESAIDELRERLGLDREPNLDGPELEVDRLPLGRLRQVQAETLSTPRLRGLWERARRFSLPAATERAATALVNRPADRDQFDHTAVFRSLIDSALQRFDRAAATESVARARQFDADAGIQPPRPTWELSEWLLSFRFDEIQDWGPQLARLMARHPEDRDFMNELTSLLLAVGLLRLVRDPSSNRLLLDGRMLEGILATYGAASRSTVDLTPVAEGQPGRLWTPGSGSAPGPAPVWSPGKPAEQTRSKLWTPEG